MNQGVRQGGVLSPVLFSLYCDEALCKLNSSGYGCNFHGIDIAALMYADDIVLISSFISLLQKLLHLCEGEFRDISLSFNVSKCEALRFGKRFRAEVVPLFNLSRTCIPWVDEIKYLGVYLVHGTYLKINVHQNKVKFSRAFNAIYAKLGSTASAETLVHLLKANCLSVLLYNLEAVYLTKTNINQLSFLLDRAFVKIFHLKDTRSTHTCQYYMYQLPIHMLIDVRKLLFWQKMKNSECFLLKHMFSCSSSVSFEELCCKYKLHTNGKFCRNSIVNIMHNMIQPEIEVEIWFLYFLILFCQFVGHAIGIYRGVARVMCARGHDTESAPLLSPTTARGSGERCKLLQRGLGQSPSGQRILGHSRAKSDRFWPVARDFPALKATRNFSIFTKN